MGVTYSGWMVHDAAKTIEELGWARDAAAVDPPKGSAVKYVKINGGEYAWLWQSEHVSIVALAYRLGWCDGATFGAKQ